MEDSKLWDKSSPHPNPALRLGCVSGPSAPLFPCLFFFFLHLVGRTMARGDRSCNQLLKWTTRGPCCVPPTTQCSCNHQVQDHKPSAMARDMMYLGWIPCQTTCFMQRKINACLTLFQYHWNNYSHHEISIPLLLVKTVFLFISVLYLLE